MQIPWCGGGEPNWRAKEALVVKKSRMDIHKAVRGVWPGISNAPKVRLANEWQANPETTLTVTSQR